MEEENDFKAMEKISSEVDESQIQVILTSQCIKAQAFLLDKLKKQSKHHKETCGVINNANQKVEAEIKHAEQEIECMLTAQETIKSGNVELRKEWLLAKSRKEDIVDRVTEGIKKYEALWSECKARYESIPFVQKLLEAKKNQEKIDQDIVNLDKHLLALYDDIETRRKHCVEVDRNRCIAMANFMVNEMPTTIKIIKETTTMINNLTKEIQQLKEQHKDVAAIAVVDAMEMANLNSVKKGQDHVLVDASNTSNYDDPLVPKLNLAKFDLDNIDINLDKISWLPFSVDNPMIPILVKSTKNEIHNIIPPTNTVNYKLENLEQRLEDEKIEYIISPHFKSYEEYKEEKTRNVPKRKLINIIQDINVNDCELYNIVKNVNPEQLVAVSEIAAEMHGSHKSDTIPNNKNDKTPVCEDIEIVDLTSSNAENIIIPPTQFLDITITEDTPNKKRVSFDLPSSVQTNVVIDEEEPENVIISEDVNINESASVNEGVNANEDVIVNESLNKTANSQLDASANNGDESFIKLRDMLFKKHNLDLSPQFVYAKNNILQKREDDKVVKSKFFQNHNNENDKHENNDNRMEVDEQLTNEANGAIKPHVEGAASEKDENILKMDLDEDVVMNSSPKINKINSQTVREQKCRKPISGLLFTHNAQGIPDSLNVSLSTTGYEESDFPHCIDSSLLLSPKADIPATNDNNEVLSQEVPNFLAGFRKTGFSFFGGGPSTSEHKPDSSAGNEGNGSNFSFNFGGEKKTRGGLFNLFG